MQYRIKLWDAPTRLFHWSLVLLFGVMWWSGETGGDALRLHLLAGYGIAGLLLFRLLWGVLGSDTARFARFVRGPGAMLAYLCGSLPEHRIPGHNPLGALMVLALPSMWPAWPPPSARPSTAPARPSTAAQPSAPWLLWLSAPRRWPSEPWP